MPDHPAIRDVGNHDSRSVARAMWRGARKLCPRCGKGPLFASYLKSVPACARCDEELHHHRADDAPPYFTIAIVGHVIVWLVLSLEMTMAPPLWLQFAMWLPAAVALSLLLLAPIKGAIIGLQWALRMHGFDRAGRESKADAPLWTGGA